MRQFICFLFILIFASCSNSNDSAYSRYGWDQVRYISYNFNLKSIIEDHDCEILNQNLYVDIDSIVICRHSLKGNFGEDVLGSLLYSSTYVFNPDGNVCQILGDYGRCDKLNYYAENRTIEKHSFNTDNELTELRRYQFDEIGSLCEITSYLPNGSLKWKEKYIYDSNGRLALVNDFGPNGELRRKETYKYNFKGDIVELIGYDSDNQPSYQLKYIYKKGSIDSICHTYSNIDLLYKFKYDKQGCVIEICEYNSDNSLISKRLYSYDSLKNINQVREYRQEIETPSYVEVYDISYRDN